MRFVNYLNLNNHYLNLNDYYPRDKLDHLIGILSNMKQVQHMITMLNVQ